MARTITGKTPRQEQRTQQRMTDLLASRIQRSFQIELNKAMREMAAAYKSPGEQYIATLNHRQRLSKLLQREYAAAFEVFGNRILEAANKSGRVPAEIKLDEVMETPYFNQLQQQWVEQYVGIKVTQISNTTAEQAIRIIQAQVEQGIVDGIGEAELAKRIDKAIKEQGGTLSRFRSRMIARTEAHAAANAATQAAAKETGLPLKKEWVASDGERTRAAHAAADGQTVLLDDYFIVDGERLINPGDPNGSPSNVINCRCVAVHVID